MSQAYNNAMLAELRELLGAILTSDVPRITDLREVERLRASIEQQDDPGFFAIRAAVSDLDTVPDESRRELFSEHFLKEQDQQCAAYLQAAADDVRKAASALLHSSWLRIP